MSFAILGIALTLSLLFVPVVRRLSFRVGKVAAPREDRWHRQPTPLLGGVGIFLAFGLSLVITSLATPGARMSHWGLLAGSCMMFILGLYDDFKRLMPSAKLVGQVLASTVVISLGYTSTFFTPRIPDSLLAQLPNILLTYFWLIGITNAINLLDNMDGLAGGIALITAVFLSYFFWKGGNQILLAISLALAGGLLGFLFFNFPPASIFMGDSGSQFIGFTLAVLAIAQQQQASNVFAVLGVPTLLFLLPILDTTLVTVTRLLRGQSPVQGGRDHTSHRLIAFGLTERQALLVLYGVAIISGFTAAALESINYWLSLVLAPILVVSFALVAAYLGGLKVVPPSGVSPQEKPLTRIMLELAFRRRLLEALLDFFLIGVAYYLAFLVRYGLSMDRSHLDLYLQTFPLALAGGYLSFYFSGVYRGIWRYVDLNDLVHYFQAALGAIVLLAAAMFLLNSMSFLSFTGIYSPFIFLLYGLFLFLGLASTRASFRIFELFSPRRKPALGQPVLIYGAGDKGEMALRWIIMNPQLDYRPVGFLDDDPYLAGRQIHGVLVLGGVDRLDVLIGQYQVEGVVYAGSEAEQDAKLQNLSALCQRHGCWLRSLQLEFEDLL